MSEALTHLGERLRKARVDAGLSQAQLGQPHFTRAYVSALELGKIRPAMKSLEFLAAKLGKPTSYFISDEKEERSQRERDLDISAAAALLARPTAAEALRRIEELFASATTVQDKCRLKLMAGTAYNYLADGTKALRELAAAERLALQLGHQDLRRAVTHQTAIALRSIGELVPARDLLRGLLAAVEASQEGDLLLRMKLLKDLGAISWDLGEHEKATAYYERALEWAKDIGDVAGLLGIYNGLAYARRSLGDLEGATTYLQRALGAAEVSNDLSAAAVVHNALAVIAAERGHMDAAQRHVDRAIELSKLIGPPSYVAHYLNTKAECLLRADQLEAVSRVALEALELAESTGNLRAAAGAMATLGEVARRRRSFQEATARLDGAAATYRRLGARQELGEVLMRLSNVAREQGDSAAAQRYAEDAYRATKTTSGLMER